MKLDWPLNATEKYFEKSFNYHLLYILNILSFTRKLYLNYHSLEISCKFHLLFFEAYIYQLAALEES